MSANKSTRSPKPQPEDAEIGTVDPVPDGVAQLAELFTGPLSDVKFPDVDSEKLSAGCDALREADREVQAAFAALEAAQGRLAEEKDNLSKLAERGLAYAKVFAAEDEELQAQLAEIQLGGSKKPARKAKAKMIPKAEKPKRAPKAAKPKEGTEASADDEEKVVPLEDAS